MVKNHSHKARMIYKNAVNKYTDFCSMSLEELIEEAEYEEDKGIKWKKKKIKKEINFIQAILLEYTIFDKDNIKASVFEVTFQDLRQSNVGDKFYANPCPSDKKYMNDIAEVLFVDGRSALVRVTEFVKNGRSETSVTHLEHIDLF